MSGQLYIPEPRRHLELVNPPQDVPETQYFLRVPCEYGEHEILISVVRALYTGEPRWFPAICEENVWPVSASHPVQSDEPCEVCPLRRERMSPQPVDWGPAWALMRCLAPRLYRDAAPRPPRNEAGWNFE
ncbi:MAG: hypothetical protein ACRDXB_07200 [Actinomycetes bacterium]